MPLDIAFRHRQAEVIPAAPPARDGREASRAGGVTGSGQRLAQRGRAIVAVQKKDGIGNQAGLRWHLQSKLLRETTALLRLGERRAVLLGDESRDVGGERVALVLVPVVVPAEHGRETARPQHLADKHRLAVADRRRPPRCGRRLAVALRDRLIERVDAGVVPRLVTVDERAGAPGLIADVQGGASALDHDRAPTVEGERRRTVVIELTLDHDPALVRDQAGGRQCRARLPVEGGRVRMRQWAGGAREPLTVQLHRARGTLNQCAVTSQYRKGAGLLVGERSQVQVVVSLASSSAPAAAEPGRTACAPRAPGCIGRYAEPPGYRGRPARSDAS